MGSQTDKSSGKQRLILVHGAGAKPAASALKSVWCDAIEMGLRRDAPRLADKLSNVTVDMVYFADHLRSHFETGFDEALDLDNRRQNLVELGARAKSKDFRRKYYETLPGKTALKEFVVDASAAVGLGRFALTKALPELRDYWHDQASWPRETRAELSRLLRAALDNADDVLLVSHCMGSVLAWDAMWELSQDLPGGGHRISHWVTLGSPLGDNAVQSKLLGAAHKGDDRYAKIISHWYNLAAEDDYVCHDKTVANDFGAMMKNKLIGDIQDHTIYNLSVRYGRSNPHSSAGYLVHPRMAEIVGRWLLGDTG